MENKVHWEHIYNTKDPREVSWFQEHAAQSIQLIKNAGVNLNCQIIDVGVGASTLVDDLLDNGYSGITVCPAKLFTYSNRLRERQTLPRISMEPIMSLDASGGSVFLNLLGAAEGALIRAAASTLTFGYLHTIG